MDDNIKIKALMVYYHHWGMDEIKAERNRRALNKTMEKICELFRSKNSSPNKFNLIEEIQFQTFFLREIQQMSFWSNHAPMASMCLLNQIANTLLSSIGGCNEIHPSLNSYFIKIAKILKMNVFSIACMDMSKEDLLSVNAIVALF